MRCAARCARNANRVAGVYMHACFASVLRVSARADVPRLYALFPAFRPTGARFGRRGQPLPQRRSGSRAGSRRERRGRTRGSEPSARCASLSCVPPLRGAAAGAADAAPLRAPGGLGEPGCPRPPRSAASTPPPPRSAGRRAGLGSYPAGRSCRRIAVPVAADAGRASQDAVSGLASNMEESHEDVGQLPGARALTRSSYSASSLQQNTQAYSRDGRVRGPHRTRRPVAAARGAHRAALGRLCGGSTQPCSPAAGALFGLGRFCAPSKRRAAPLPEA